MDPSSFDLVQSKLDPPAARRGIVARTPLLDRLVAAASSAVVSVVAPAGYGKTTFLAQWAESKEPRVGWVSVDDRDNDPVVLLSYIAVALDRIEAIDPRVFRALSSSGAGPEGPRWLVAAMARMRRPGALVIDNLEVVTNPESLDAVAALALGLPMGWQLAIGSRATLPLPTPRLRAQGGIVEVGADGLAMDKAEAQSLLIGAGVELAESDLDVLVERTEGWPAGLYLAALAINAGGAHVDVAHTFTGDDRFMGDYLRTEFLDRVSRADVSFLVRTSILERLSGPLCDVTVGRKGSGHILDRLERNNLLVTPLDHRGEWYRYHHLFRELLHAELRHREPEIIPALHVRAAEWYEANGFPEAAIEHAQAAGDADTVARLVLQICNSVMGEWTHRHRPALDGVVRGQRPDRALPGDRRHRGVAVRDRRTAGRDGALGGRRRANQHDRSALRREHDRGHAGLLAGEPVPRRDRGDATRRSGGLAWTQPAQSVSRQHDPGLGSLASARGRRRPRRWRSSPAPWTKRPA